MSGDTAVRATEPTDYARAITLFRSGHFAAALELLQRQLDAEPDHVGSLFGAGVCRARLGDAAGAAKTLQKLTAVDPSHVLGHIELGNVYVSLDRPAEARAAYTAVLNLQPGNPVATAALSRLSRPETSPQSEAAGSTLAGELDQDGADLSSGMAGEVLTSGHRGLWSHRRLWLGAALLLYVPLATIAERRLDAAAQVPPANPPAIPGGPDGVALVPDIRAGAVTDILLGWFVLLLDILGYAVLLLSIALVAGALLSSRMSRYVVRERRIEITRGVLFRSRRYVWLYAICDLELVQDPLLLMAGTAKLKLIVEDTQAGTSRRPRRTPAIVGFRDTAHLRRLHEQLELRVRLERRAMKKAFI